ncbi:MAG: Spy/CpxP family protein refolding chaperone [Holophagaceae bacterium]|uniref:Spy/CpxP family protein refolding chaperone n=1 Tax=Candidatus Geothrix skivensis TaxID=2954439 RepID=A0A9D7SGM4_9BACT|nr:Spy/CpxP family protein refolding chaperone [Candidatus Geothrix skivensis]
MTTHPLRLAALALALTAIGTSLSAQGPGSGPGRGHGPMGEGRGLRGLNLTEAQQAQVKAIHDKHQASVQAKQEVAVAARKAMHEAMASTATEPSTLKALHDKVSAAQLDLMLEHRAVRQEILPLLTPEQKTRFEKPGRGMGPRGGRGRGPGRGFGAGHPGMGPDCPLVKPT